MNEMIVYVDVIFLENLILDFIILLATGIISNSKLKIFRLIVSSSLGSICTVISFIFNVNEFVLKILMSFLIIFICFGFKNKRLFLKNLFVFYLTTITFGGTSFMFLFLVNPKEVVYNTGHFLGLYPVKMALMRRICWIFFDCWSSKNVKKKVFEVL